ncbi:hypothetical protein MSAN_02127500 [Mycena sanguinolenta]|uniref:Uncharacterized protein n=1 Tax=Mycena sanguinolenta TaxID=230812 RepID=A0A8H6XFM2_9AGAR|nr:hypothetical protein MSAN_02127500 [Mycena sanguinolenta]
MRIKFTRGLSEYKYWVPLPLQFNLCTRSNDSEVIDMSSSQDLATVRTTIGSVTTGKAVNQDAWMTTWCSTNWGELLQPAPLSISLLGSVLIIASSTDDFSLDSKAPEGCPPFVWKYALRPDSFKSCLQQMVGDGYRAFETAHAKMEVINNCSGQMPGVIADIVNLVLKGSVQDIEDLFQNMIDDVQGLSAKCRDAAHDCEQEFLNMCGLAQEMVLACTYTAGTAQQALVQNNTNLEVLRVQKESQEKMVQEAKANNDLMKKSYLKAEEQFQQAVNDVPSGWDLVGMQVVESLTNLVVSAGNAAISAATMKSQAASAGINAFSSLTGGNKQTQTPAPTPVAPSTAPNGVSSQPNGAALSDPGTLMVSQVLTQANAIKLLVAGNSGKPDWDRIRAAPGGGTGGAAYVQATLNSQKGQLAAGKPISTQLSTCIDKGLAILAEVIRWPPTDQLITDLQGLVTTANLILQQPGTTATGPATPPTPASSSTSATKLAVENAKMKVDQTRSQLEASRESFEKASERLATQQQDITKTIGEMTRLTLTTNNLQQMLPVLTKAVGAFTTLRAQFSQLLQFFESVASLLIDVMGPSVDRWVSTMKSAEQQRLRTGSEPQLAGITVSNFTRDLIYRQMMMPLKVSYLSTSISTVYLAVSNDYILPAQRQVGSMLQFPASSSAADKVALNQRLTVAQASLAKSATSASNEILSRVQSYQKTFASSIDTRLNAIVSVCQPVIPAVTAPVPSNLKAITNAHVKDTDATKALQAAANPMFEEDSAM